MNTSKNNTTLLPRLPEHAHKMTNIERSGAFWQCACNALNTTQMPTILQFGDIPILLAFSCSSIIGVSFRAAWWLRYALAISRPCKNTLPSWAASRDILREGLAAYAEMSMQPGRRARRCRIFARVHALLILIFSAPILDFARQQYQGVK